MSTPQNLLVVAARPYLRFSIQWQAGVNLVKVAEFTERPEPPEGYRAVLSPREVEELQEYAALPGAALSLSDDAALKHAVAGVDEKQKMARLRKEMRAAEKAAQARAQELEKLNAECGERQAEAERLQKEVAQLEGRLETALEELTAAEERLARMGGPRTK